MKVKSTLIELLFLFFLLLGLIGFLLPMPTVFADPTNQSKIQAQAGNVTQLTIFGEQQTDHWVGYFGNITGEIILDNADNWTMYEWAGITYPEGEVYAANDSVTNWGAIMCINLSSNHPGFNCSGQNEECLNVTELETYFGIEADDADGFDETFNRTLAMIMIGEKPLYNCSKTNLYINDTIQNQNDWNETLLTINNTATVIFTAIIQDDMWGFNNQTWDFQIMVTDDGSDEQATTYYMYIELS